MQRRVLFFSSLLGLGVIGTASVAVSAHAATLTASVTVNRIWVKNVRRVNRSAAGL